MKNKGVFLAAILTVVLCFSGNVLAYPGGDGSAGNPYQISSFGDWFALMGDSGHWGSCFILTADVDLVGAGLAPVGNNIVPFTGIFDGGGHIISNAFIIQPGDDFIGLFGFLGPSGQIRNLGVENVNITGNDYVGGLVGINVGSLTACYSTGDVSGNGAVGGLVGENDGFLTACYATGSVTGIGWDVGGLVGENWGTATACFWDIQTCFPATVGVGFGTSAGVIGKITLQMKTQSTFTSAGWDFSATDGDPADWWMPADSYPRLVYITSTPDHYTSGNGSPGNPYQIANVDDFDLLTLDPNNWDKCFILTADINLIGRTFTHAPIAPDTNDADWDFQGTPFTGIFDGNSHTISNLTIPPTEQSYIGLFGNNQGAIHNLGVVDVNIREDSGNYVGGLVGWNSGTLTDCYAKGFFLGNAWVGGLVGYNDGTLTDCNAKGSVSGNGYVGGLVGMNGDYGEPEFTPTGGPITSCHANCSVTGISSVGGLVGVNWGPLTSCYAIGSVSGGGLSQVGGLVGANGDSMDMCYATGPVSGNNYVGGLVGWNWHTTLTSCYATGPVSGVDYVGGLAGRNSSTLTDCNATGSSVTGNNYVGGLTGVNEADYDSIALTDCNAKGDVIGNNYVGGLTGWNDAGYGSITLTSCYAEGDVTGYDYVGSLVGLNDGTLTDCYATGFVTGTGGVHIGGLVGNNTGAIVNLVLAGPGKLENVQAIANPPSGNYPLGLNSTYFPIGFFEFTVSDIPMGGSTTVNIFYEMPPGQTVNTYYKYGKEAVGDSNHWYPFIWDGTTGAQFGSNAIILHFVDGQRGDDDLTVNGKIVDPGGPAFIATFGSLQVTLGPAAAVTAGAQWNVDGGVWRNSGVTVSGLSVGSHTVNYNVVTGWTSPANQNVSISNGATTNATGSYTYYVGYSFGGILQPINADGSSIFKLGSTVQVKFQLRDAAGNFVTNAVAKLYLTKIDDAVEGSDLEAVSTSAATTGNLFRYADNQYIFNLGTKSLTAGTWRLNIVLDDGTSRYVDISLRK